MPMKPLLAAAIALTLAGPALGTPVADDGLRRVPSSVAEMQLSFAPVVEATTPAVVNVYAKRVVKQVYRSPMFDDPLFRRFFDERMLGMPQERVQSSLGSGVIVGADGIVVTNNHVIAGGEELTVALPDRREFSAKVLLADERTDLAVLKIDAKGEALPALRFGNSDNSIVGDIVLAIGNPFGVGQTVTQGIVSALARTQVGVTDYQFFIQTDAAINPGNSGGALVNIDGELVGINTAIYSRGGGSNGVGFAIPSNMVRLVVEQATKGGKIVRPWFGATGQAVTPAIAESLGLSRPQGVLLTGVDPQSPAGKAGLRQGDLVLSIGGFEVDDIQSLRYRVATQRVGENVQVAVLSQAGQRTVTVRLAAPPEVPPRSPTLLDGRQPLAGATVINLSPAVNDEIGLDPMTRGVMVSEVVPRSPARRYGLGAGDIVRTVNGREIGSIDDLTRALNNADGSWLIEIERGGRVLKLEVRG